MIEQLKEAGVRLKHAQCSVVFRLRHVAHKLDLAAQSAFASFQVFFLDSFLLSYIKSSMTCQLEGRNSYSVYDGVYKEVALSRFELKVAIHQPKLYFQIS